MRFDEIDFEDEVLDGLYDMNFEEMTPPCRRPPFR